VTAIPYPWQISQWRRLIGQLHGDRLAHGYLLTGEPGLGKKDFAIAAAQLLLCENPEESDPCNACRSCELFKAGTNPDLLTIAPESSRVIKVDQIRQLTEFANKTSHGKKRKLVVLDRVEALNINAANALLKTLEEPPANTVLFLITANPGRLLATITSRCQRVLFTPPAFSVAREWLIGKAGQTEGLESLLRMARGRPLSALQLLNSEEVTEQTGIIEALTAIFAGRLDPVEFSSHGKNIGADKILEQLWYLTAGSIKGFLIQNPHAETDDQLQFILRNLAHSKRSKDELLARLMSVNGSVDEARRQLASTSNPNPQLLLEGILWRWSRLIR
jgi:DNA polymerase-3 subunit delta'